ncbi:MAG: DUF3014 domain-containing protein [Deltaproteobacteria bacterium]|jgi:hypothetical protein
MTRNSWVLLSLTLVAGGVAAWWFLGRGADVVPSAPEPSPPPVVAAEPVVLDAGVEEDEAPPRSGPTGEVRLREDLAERLAGSSGAAWVAAPGLLQRLTAAVWLVSQGRSPRAVLGFVSVTGDFEVDETSKIDDPIWMSEKSYRRYDRIVEALDKVGPTSAAKIYRATKQSFTREFRQVASDGESFDAVLRKAIDHLLEVDVPDERIEVKVKGGIFVYADPKLEGLSDAQKHLVRMGPKNAKAAQDFLTAFSESL